MRAWAPSNVRMTDEPELTPALSDLAFHILLALGHGSLHGYAIGRIRG